MSLDLEAKLSKIRSPNLKNQKQVAIVLSAVEDTLKEQNTEFTPTAYFVALLSLLQGSISSSTIRNKDVAASSLYLLDIFAPLAPKPLLKAKFVHILKELVPALTNAEADAPLLRSAIGVLEGLLLAQDGSSWAIPQKELGPRRAVGGLLALGQDSRPKVRRRAQDALTNLLKNPPPSPSLDHPASDMCAATTLLSVQTLMKASQGNRKRDENDPGLIHSLQLVKAVASAGGWPSKRIDELCHALLTIAKGGNQFLAKASLDVFEEVFGGLVDEVGGGKLEVVIEAISELRPSQNDSQLLPAWLTVIARGHEVYAQVFEDRAFKKLPELFSLISTFLQSGAHDVRQSSSQCLISLVDSCIPESSLLDITRITEKIFQDVATAATELLSVRYQGAWMEVFDVLSALFVKLRWRSDPVLSEAVKIVGDLRGNEGFQGKKEADALLSAAVHAMGPDIVLPILPLNLANPKAGQPGRAWMLPILRDSVYNTKLCHFRQEMVPLSEGFFQKVVDFGDEQEKTVEIKIFETLVGQIWALLPGYCDLPIDLTDAFDQTFAELLANVLYQKVELRSDICKAMQNLIDSNKLVLEMGTDEDGEEYLIAQRRITKEQAQKNLDHIAGFSGNMLAVLFNVYSITLPQFRGFILKCLNSFLSITPHQELMSTFEKVTTMLESSLAELKAQTQADKQKKKEKDAMPPMAHTLMDLVITITPYLPAESYGALFGIFNATVSKGDDPQLQKKAYKVVPRLAETEAGRAALQSKSEILQELLIKAGETATAPARRDRLIALTQMVELLPDEDLHFIPSVLSEVVMAAKEVNEKARTAAFDLLIAMGLRMRVGGVLVNSRVPHMSAETPDAKATLEEYFTMVSAGLAGNSPNMVSAAITALTRILWEFKDDVDKNLVSELVATLDAFLTSKNREIVRSVLGFVKVCIISLPREMIEAKFSTLIPNLMVWSHEHKAHFKAKVKHLLERMVRRFGVAVIERYMPEEDKKLLTNIRKSRERAKRKKEETKTAAAAGSDDEEEIAKPKRKGKFENEFDEAIYGSESDGSGSDADDVDMDGAPMTKRKASKKQQQQQTFIIEDGDEPLDLLDRNALAHISSTRPLKPRVVSTRKKTTAKVNMDGKLVFGGDEDVEMISTGSKKSADDDGDLDMDSGIGGVDAYVEAVTGKNAYTRGQHGKVKFSNKRAREDDVEMEDGPIDDEDISNKAAGHENSGKRARKELPFKKGKGGKGGLKKQQQERKGLGSSKQSRGKGRR